MPVAQVEPALENNVIERTLSEKPMLKLFTFEPSDLQFGYDAKDPTLRSKPFIEKNYGRAENYDPWGPCYLHDEESLATVLTECTRRAPLGTVPVGAYRACYEGLSRTNAWATYDDAYYRDGDDLPDWWKGPGEKPWEGILTFNGRRIEIHPAVTRCVAAHEYGHLVEEAVQRIRYPGARGHSTLLADYKRVRKLENVTHYGNGTHHLAASEVFANDFRTYVMETEVEFWPHPVKRPGQLVTVSRWWDKVINDLTEFAKTCY